jgi:aminodeoxyfutalosine deaminase
MATPPLPHAAIHLTGNRIEYLGASNDADEHDLGDVAIIPAWINAHAHLDLSHHRQPVGTPGMSMAAWIALLVRDRSQAASDLSTVARSWHEGLRQSHAHGVRLVADIVAHDLFATLATPEPTALAASLRSAIPTGIDIHCFSEVLGLSETRRRECWQRMEGNRRAVVTATGPAREANPSRFQHAISPHAPYSTPSTLVADLARDAIDNHEGLAMHLAESIDEMQLIDQATGPMRDVLDAIGIPVEPMFPNPMAIDEAIDAIAKARFGLLVHGNHFAERHFQQIARHRHLTIVHCPRTHAYFGHTECPIASAIKHQVRVALGTDSRASNPDLDPWHEVRWLLDHRSALSPQWIVQAATLHGGDAVGRSDLGRLAVGSCPGLLAIAVEPHHRDAYEAIAHSPSQPWRIDR